ncbi:MAG: pyridoxal phosphate-dependent decarboxylase family protein [Candidatus Helarchaeota archaeon]
MTRQKVILPKKGKPEEELFDEMEKARKNDLKWREARNWSLVYTGGPKHDEIIKKALTMFFSENALSGMAFPSLKKFEIEVVAMTADLLGGDRRVVGTLTSGGTESILMAMKTYRDWAREKHPEIKKPEIILPMTIHPSFGKGAHYFDIKPVYTPIDPETLQADVNAILDAVNEKTIAIAGSAVCYPYGVVDPIPEMAAIAEERGIGCHVDACLGGFFLPFIRKLGYPVPEFDFKIRGVTSISADVHKYGYGAKGASVILYRKEKWRLYQYHAYCDWVGGLYASPAMLGTRPGGAVAAAWAAMMSLGEEGYLERAKIIMETAEKIINGINSIPELIVKGKPTMGVLAFESEKINIYSVGDEMEKLGWHLDYLQKPPCLHLIINPHHVPVADKFIEDLQRAVMRVREKPTETIEGTGAMYGMMAKIPDRESVHDFVVKFLSDFYKL